MKRYSDHMDVGIRELKAKLSEYVARARRGEVIRVTDRGVPVAQLTPLPAEEEDPIDRGIREGWITPGNGAPVREEWKHFKASRSLEEILAEDRGED
jgi:prevent-host-death family protein